MSPTQTKWPNLYSVRPGRPIPPISPPSRARLGVIVPSVNTVVEPWFSAVAPAGVTVHTTRMLLGDKVTTESLRQMDREEGLASAARIATCKPDAVAYCCTASSVVQGLDYDSYLRRELEHVTACPCFTAVGALIDALKSLGARTLCIASPYTDAIDHAERCYFEAAGFRVLGAGNLGIADSFALASPSAEEIYQLAGRVWHDSADVLVISCLNMRSHEVVESVEEVTGRPVVTSTTATLWKLMRTAGLDDRIAGYGRLLATC